MFRLLATVLYLLQFSFTALRREQVVATSENELEWRTLATFNAALLQINRT